ncbi:MAG: acylhydrolase [Pedobacter sp.]|nr:acylhydrolase [Pedobacter sp.]
MTYRTKMKKVFFSFLIIIAAFHADAQNDTTNVYSSTVSKEDYKDDWADLHHYQATNKQLGVPAAGEKRVVFLGSSIFERWADVAPEFFSNKNYVNRGISGQISPQLLIRFRQDVIDLNPSAVVILAGSNDIAVSTGHVTNATIMDNIKSMSELAKAHGIKVIICAYLPVFDYPWRKGLQPANKIIALNKDIKAYVNKEGFTLLDYFSPFADERNGQKKELTLDGVHPNAAGYGVMAKITEDAIAKALR